MKFASLALLALIGVTFRAERTIALRGPIGSFTVLPGERVSLQALNKRWSWTAPRTPGLYPIDVASADGRDSLRIQAFVLVPFHRIRDGHLNGYRIGRYPRLRRPNGFIEVTRANREANVSPNFKLKQFVCKQAGAYPKYIVLNPALVQRLEELLELVNRSGYHATTFHVMSGYRTPDYNRAIGNVANSRHIWGAAADIFIDEDGDGRMDDLNGDGRSDTGDADVLYRLFDGPQRAGGLGKYDATAAHGPFVHVDLRDRRARW